MSKITFTINKTSQKNINLLINRLGKEELFRGIQNFFTRQALIGSARIADTMLSGQRLNRQTGTLAKSLTGTGLRVDGVPALRMGIFRGPALKYAGIQNLGTKKYNPASPYDTIRPKKGKALAIPLDPVKTGTGLDKYGGPRGFPGELHFIPFRKSGIAIGALYDDHEYDVAREFGLREAKAAYLLMTEVDIKPTFYLRDGFRNFLPILTKNLAAYLKDQVALTK